MYKPLRKREVKIVRITQMGANYTVY